MIFPRSCLIQFARYPDKGQVKTRLRGALSEDQILRLHCQLVRHTNATLNAADLAPVHLAYGRDRPVTPGDDFLAGLAAAACFRQCAGDLGAKMHGAFAQVFGSRAPGGGVVESAVLVGSDCPFIDRKVLRDALETLAQGCDLVLGPAEDGGYYLIGLQCPQPSLFQDVPWGGTEVLATTLDLARRGGLQYHLLQTLADIDNPSDIPKLTKEPEYAWLKKQSIL